MWDPSSVAISTPDPSPGVDSVITPGSASEQAAETDMRHESHSTAEREAVGLRERWAEITSDRILTLPNVISIARLAGVPLFLWFALVTHQDGNAVWVLIGGGVSDWLDGKAARWLNQFSRLGEMLDPVADRLYIVATLAAFLIRDIVPWWVVAVLISRDLVLAVFVPILRNRGYGPFKVLYVGKAATFNLLYAFPLLLCARGETTIWPGWEQLVPALAYAFTVWGAALYMWSGVIYVVQFGMAMGRPVPTPIGGADRLSG
jgi:cardiolipin synthase